MIIPGVACSGLERSNSLKMIKAFMRGAEETGHQTDIIKIHQNLLGCTGCGTLEQKLEEAYQAGRNAKKTKRL